MPMSDEQVHALMQNWRDELKKNMDEMTLRKWCIEKSIEAHGAGASMSAGDILYFITEPIYKLIKGSAAEE